ncbi:MAG: ATP-binding protein [Acidobacteriota bacterium]
MRIATKITLGYLILILLMIAVSLYELSLIQRMQSINRRLLNVNYEAGLSSLQLLNDLYQIDDFTSKFLATGDREYGEELQDLVERFGKDIQSILALGLSDLEEREFRGLSEIWAKFSQTLSPLLQSADVSTHEQEQTARQMGRLLNQTRRLIPITREALRVQVGESQRTHERAQNVFWGAGVATLGLALITAFLIVRSIHSPIHRLTRGTRALADGDFTFRVDESGPDEIGELTRHFNSMVRRLGELDQLKQDFLSHVSHELKAPLASLRETTSLLLDQIAGPLNEKQAELLKLNLECGARLSEMIDNVLDLSRLESGLMEYEFKPEDLTSLLTRVISEMDPLVQEKECGIEAEFPNESVSLACDGGRIMQVARNLMDNALNFSPPGSTIRVRLTLHQGLPRGVPAAWRRSMRLSEGEWTRVSIADAGPGVDDAQKGKIFDKFHQVRRGGKVTGQGVGLGLAISRTIIQAHGGAIWVEDSPDGGSVFSFLLARRQSATAKRASLPV